MPPFRIAVPLFASLLLAGPLLAEDRKPAATAATVEELYENPKRFHSKLVQVEGVIESTPDLCSSAIPKKGPSRLEGMLAR
jgi:hypothetical protein